MGSINVRAVEDYNLCRRLQLETLPGDVPIATGMWWVAYEDGNEVGFVCLQVEGPYGYIARTGVVECARGKRLQRRMQYVAQAAARKMGCTHMVSDTANWNHASSNTFIGMGYKLYTPTVKWGWPDGLYWIKEL